MKYILNKGLTFSVREWVLILLVITVLVMFGLVISNNQLGIDILQFVIAGKA